MTPSHLARATLRLVAILGGATSGLAAQTVETQRLSFPTPAPTAVTANALAASPNFVALRYPRFPRMLVQLWRRGTHGWAADGEVDLPDLGPGIAAGQVIALTDSILVAGTWQFDSFRGIVHVLERSVGGWPASFPPGSEIESPFSAGGTFGLSLDVDADGRWLVVGAPNAQGLFHGFSGRVAVYERTPSGWSLDAILAPPPAYERELGLLYGRQVAVDGDTIAVTADGSFPGTLFVYEQSSASGWSESYIFTDLNPEFGDEFGSSVDVEGDTIVVGERNSSVTSPGLGRAYVFERDSMGGWAPTATLRASNGSVGFVQGDVFGGYVATDGENVVVGAQGAVGVNGLNDDGAIYVFRRNRDGSWNPTETERLWAEQPGTTLLGRPMAYSAGVTVAASGVTVVSPNGEAPLYIHTPGVGRDVCGESASTGGQPLQLDLLTADPARPRVCVWGGSAGASYIVAVSARPSMFGPVLGVGAQPCIGAPSLRVASGTLAQHRAVRVLETDIARISALPTGAWTAPLYFQCWSRAASGATSFSRMVQLVPR